MKLRKVEMVSEGLKYHPGHTCENVIMSDYVMNQTKAVSV